MTKGSRRGWGVSFTHRPLFNPGKDPAPIVQEAGWASGLVWTGVENLAPTGVWSPDRPARSQSLYRLRYPAHIRYWRKPQMWAGILIRSFLCTSAISVPELVNFRKRLYMKHCWRVSSYRGFGRDAVSKYTVDKVFWNFFFLKIHSKATWLSTNTWKILIKTIPFASS